MMDNLDLMIELLGNPNVSNEILTYYISKAELAIKNYSNIDTIPDSFIIAIVELAIYFYKNKDLVGIKSMMQGSRSQSISEGIPEEIKALLPIPKVKVMG